MLIISLAAYDRSTLRLVSVCSSRFGSKLVGLSGPREALTVIEYEGLDLVLALV